MYKLRFFIPFAVMITCLCGLIYFIAQQSYRQSANDPQIQMSEDAAVLLSEGNSPTVYQEKVDIGKSLSPFVIVYDASGKVVTSGATLSGKIPVLPQGVLIGAKNGRKTITWQPQRDVGIAAATTYYSQNGNSGYVLAGRSLREAEARVKTMGIKVLTAWIVTLVATCIAFLLFLPTVKAKKR